MNIYVQVPEFHFQVKKGISSLKCSYFHKDLLLFNFLKMTLYECERKTPNIKKCTLLRLCKVYYFVNELLIGRYNRYHRMFADFLVSVSISTL